MFIKTTDGKTAELLISLNFVLISQDGNVWTFLNDHDKIVEDNHIIITDVLEV